MNNWADIALPFILLGIAGAIFRAVILLVRKKEEPDEIEEEEESLFNSPKNWGKKK
jgi:hypothetical protein